MTRVTIPITEVGQVLAVGSTSPTALSGGSIIPGSGALVNTDDVSDLLFYVDNTGPAGDVEIAAGSYSPAIRQGLGIAYIPFGGTATGVFRIEGARHVQGGQVFINFDSNMTGFVYCFRAKAYGAGQS
jgi:hypothetical protein